MGNDNYQQILMRQQEELEESLVNRIDAMNLFHLAFEKLEELRANPDYFTSRTLQAQHDLILNGMWQVWHDKELEEDFSQEDKKSIAAKLYVAGEKGQAQITKVEITGPDGGPIESIGYLNKQDRELLGSVKELLSDGIRKNSGTTVKFIEPGTVKAD